jgi:hypothetical protein
MKMTLLLILALATPAVGNAQLATVAPGSRVRVFAPKVSADKLVGTLAFGIIDTVSLDVASARRTIPVNSLERLELSRGKTRRAGAVRGVKVGLLVAGAYAVVAFASKQGSYASQQRGLPTALVNSLAVGAGSVAVGALIGSRYRVESWTTVYPKLPPRATRTY